MSGIPSIQSHTAAQAAYGKTRELRVTTSDAATQTGETGATTFAQMVEQGAAEAVKTVRDGDAAALAGLSGQAGMQQVVEATMALESTVRVSVSLRDKLVEAYQEVMRMPI